MAERKWACASRSLNTVLYCPQATIKGTPSAKMQTVFASQAKSLSLPAKSSNLSRSGPSEPDPLALLCRRFRGLPVHDDVLELQIAHAGDIELVLRERDVEVFERDVADCRLAGIRLD